MNMSRNQQWGILAGVTLAFLGCYGSRGDERQPQIGVIQITASQLPTAFDTDRTFHRRIPGAQDPEGMLLALADEGLRPIRAWEPLDNLCLDPVGPTFTVELFRNDPRIEGKGYDRGDGRLGCSTQLLLYDVSYGGS
jgi:hypothetical protein